MYLNNLQQGDEGAASRNAFGATPAELDQRATQYLAAGSFTAVPPAGPPINPDRDFDSTKVSDSDLKDALAALKSDGKDFPADSPRGLVCNSARATPWSKR